MAFCNNCEKEIPEGSDVCQICGDKPTAEPISQPPFRITEEDFISFIGKNSPKYVRKFKKFNIDGVDKFKITWHWPAFLFSFWWLLYRKLYLWILFALSVIVILPFSSAVFGAFFSYLTKNLIKSAWWGQTCALLLFVLVKMIWGISGNFIYYKQAKTNIIDLKNKQSSLNTSDVSTSLGKIGGINKWMTSIAVILNVIIITFMAAIIIPVLSGYQPRARNSEAQAYLRDAATAQEAYYVDNQTYTDSTKNLFGETYGILPNKDISLKILFADKSHYKMETFHKKGDKKYKISGPGGKIQKQNK